MIGITLSGGGTRGIAHLGVLHALEELNIKIDKIAGVSAGAIAGALYSAGYKPEEILKMIVDYPKIKFFQPSLMSSLGFFDMKPLQDLIKKYIPHNDFSQLKIPLSVGATDVEEGKEVIFSEGDLATCLMASSCVPILFKPIQYEGKMYLDGGLLNGMIVKPLEDCHKIIGVHVNPFNKKYPLKNAKDIFERCFTLAVHSNSRHNFSVCDVVIEPLELANWAAFRLDKARQMYEIGYYATMEKKEELLKLI